MCARKDEKEKEEEREKFVVIGRELLRRQSFSEEL